MDYRYRYNWQGDTQLGFNSPLVVGMKFADLKTGQVYQILSIGVAGPAERVGLNPRRMWYGPRTQRAARS
jgi:hypothetical protein